MRNRPLCETLEGRAYCAKTQAALDPTYHLAADAVRKIAGANVETCSATAGPDGRTYLLAQYFDDPNADRSMTQRPGEVESPGRIAIVAVRSDGTLDPTFGTHGVALTGLRPQPLVFHESPGFIKADSIGRVYFADNGQVLRLHADGTADRSFGKGGVVTYASSLRPTSLTDIEPTDAGVYLSVYAVDRGRETFSVTMIGRHLKGTVYTATHDSGNRSRTFNGTDLVGFDAEVPAQTLSDRTARFARSRGGLVLAFVEQTVRRVAVHGHKRTETTSDVVVTRINPDGRDMNFARHDVGHAELRKNPASGNYAESLDSVALSPSGRVVTVVSGHRDVLQFTGTAGRVHRYDRPAFDGDTPPITAFPDGSLYALDGGFLDPGDHYHWEIHKYAVDGTPDLAFGIDGVATIRDTQLQGDDLFRIFPDASGRLNLFALSGAFPTSVTLARLAAV